MTPPPLLLCILYEITTKTFLSGPLDNQNYCLFINWCEDEFTERIHFFFFKIFRVFKGRGDVFDTSGRLASARGAAMSIRNLDTGTSGERTINLSQENEDLKVRVSVGHASGLHFVIRSVWRDVWRVSEKCDTLLSEVMECVTHEKNCDILCEMMECVTRENKCDILCEMMECVTRDKSWHLVVWSDGMCDTREKLWHLMWNDGMCDTREQMWHLVWNDGMCDTR